MGQSSPTYSDVKKDSFCVSGADLGLLRINRTSSSDENIAKYRRKNVGFEIRERWA